MDDLNKSDKALLQDIKDNKVKEEEGRRRTVNSQWSILG
jgi:hypothetical protein